MRKFFALSALCFTLISCSSSDDNGVQKEDDAKMFRIEVTNTSDNLASFEKNITMLFMADNEEFEIIENPEWKDVITNIAGMITFFKVDSPVLNKEVYTASKKALTGSYAFGIIKTIDDNSTLNVNVKVFQNNKLIRDKNFNLDNSSNAQAHFQVEF